MEFKRIARNGLIVLGVVVALSMFFARTVMTMTTPKVNVAALRSGRLEQTTYMKAKLCFPESQPRLLKQAMQHPVVIERVYVREGYPVKAGDLLFTAMMPDYTESMDELRDQYDGKAQELALLDIENRKRGRTNEQNERYEAMIAAMVELSSVRVAALALAMNWGISLPEDINAWAEAAAGDDALYQAVLSAQQAQAALVAIEQSFFNSYKENKVNKGATIFEYIRKREVIVRAMDDLEAQMAALDAAEAALCEVRAERDGYIASVGVKEGDNYDGKKAAYALDDPDNPPVLRADAGEVSRRITEDATVQIKGDYDTFVSSVSDIGYDAEGKRYVDVAITDQMIGRSGGLYAMFARGEYSVSVSDRASDAGVLVPAGALRDDGGEEYVYLVEERSGLTGAGMYVIKTPVTVLNRSDTMASIAEDLENARVAYREDRAIEDGDRVMEYLD